jgi:hypothetical protein
MGLSFLSSRGLGSLFLCSVGQNKKYTDHYGILSAPIPPVIGVRVGVGFGKAVGVCDSFGLIPFNYSTCAEHSRCYRVSRQIC